LKKCGKCGELKPFEYFYKAKGMKDGYRSDCKACNLVAKAARHASHPQPGRLRAAQWNKENPERYRANQRAYVESGRKSVSDRKSHLKRKFGLTQAEYDELLELQDGGCAICGELPGERVSLRVDHDHLTGEVRGILCVRCHNALGLFREDPALLTEAAHYLVFHRRTRLVPLTGDPV
jgi:hypothetical protein